MYDVTIGEHGILTSLKLYCLCNLVYLKAKKIKPCSSVLALNNHEIVIWTIHMLIIVILFLLIVIIIFLCHLLTNGIYTIQIH